MTKLRLEITKGEAVRYISHLDYSRTVERALRRAKLPVAYSEGFNPHMKIAFASALSLGVTSEAEYLDVELKEAMDSSQFATALTAELPAGIELRGVRELAAKHTALMATVNLAVYRIIVPLKDNLTYDTAAGCVERFNQTEQIPYVKESPKGSRQIDAKQYLARYIVAKALPDGIELELAIRITATGSIKPSEVLKALVSQFGLAVDQSAAFIHRVGLYVSDGNDILSPLAVGTVAGRL